MPMELWPHPPVSKPHPLGLRSRPLAIWPRPPTNKPCPLVTRPRPLEHWPRFLGLRLYPLERYLCPLASPHSFIPRFSVFPWRFKQILCPQSTSSSHHRRPCPAWRRSGPCTRWHSVRLPLLWSPLSILPRGPHILGWGIVGRDIGRAPCSGSHSPQPQCPSCQQTSFPTADKLDEILAAAQQTISASEGPTPGGLASLGKHRPKGYFATEVGTLGPGTAHPPPRSLLDPRCGGNYFLHPYFFPFWFAYPAPCPSLTPPSGPGRERMSRGPPSPHST